MCLLHDNLLHLVALLDDVEASGERLGAVANECARGAIDLHLAIGSVGVANGADAVRVCRSRVGRSSVADIVQITLQPADTAEGEATA